MEPLDSVAPVGRWNATFAERDARRTSPVYADWAAGIARDSARIRRGGFRENGVRTLRARLRLAAMRLISVTRGRRPRYRVA